MNHPTDIRIAPSNGGRHSALALLGATGVAAALPRFAIAQSRPLKIGYITALSGPRAPFGVADEWHLAKVRELVKNGLDIGGKRVPVEIVLKDNQSDTNRSIQVANDLVLRDKVDLMLVQDGDAMTTAGQLCDVQRTPTPAKQSSNVRDSVTPKIIHCHVVLLALESLMPLGALHPGCAKAMRRQYGKGLQSAHLSNRRRAERAGIVTNQPEGVPYRPYLWQPQLLWHPTCKTILRPSFWRTTP